MKPRIRVGTYDFFAFVKRSQTQRKFSIFWGYYTITGNFRYWQPNAGISMTADEQYEQNKANYPDFVISESMGCLMSRVASA